ncbi:HNH endonuclease [Micromonospora saelicesensis]|uniref:HNH endonuclease n=1 Tax=Micromonospora saelicesensis TaxID=285676 RepID=UPI003D8EA8CC
MRPSAHDARRPLRGGCPHQGARKAHDGPDVHSNVLCLCPNDHVRLDAGSIYIDATGIVRDSSTHAAIGPLRRSLAHNIDPTQLTYHREHHVP